MTRHKRPFGEVSRLPSGRFRARYTWPGSGRSSAPTTFATRTDADRWLAIRHSELLRLDWTSGVSGTRIFREYSRRWLTDRPLKPRTRAHYAKLLENQLLPTFGDMALRTISPAMVRRWHSRLPSATPTLRAHAYGLLRLILQTAVYDGEVSANPAHIRGAGSTTRAVQISPASLDELSLLVRAMPERLALMVLWPRGVGSDSVSSLSFDARTLT